MQKVFVVSVDRKPLDPCHPARARELLRSKRAAIFRRYPFTIRAPYHAASVSPMQ
ncbi:MAG: RRXRR domain-containing protein [Chloroflexota bacterium]